MIAAIGGQSTRGGTLPASSIARRIGMSRSAMKPTTKNSTSEKIAYR